MLHHVSVGVANVARAAKFYDTALAALGYKRVMEFLPYGIAYGETSPEFWIQIPHNGQPHSAGNGTHVAFAAASQKLVHAFHEAALAAGGSDEGAPGPRPEYSVNYYGGFVRDPDGNKLEAIFFAMPAKASPKKSAKPKAKAKKAKPAKKAAPKRKAPARRVTSRRPGRKR